MNQAISHLKKEKVMTVEQMHLVFAQRGHTNTFIESQQVTYPYHVGRCLYFPDDPKKLCNVYIQSCSGGMFDYDRWQSKVIVKESAQVHLSTSASNIIHRCEFDYAQQTQYFEVKEGAYLEFIPMSNILFPQSKFHSKIEVSIEDNATICFFDSFQASILKDDDRSFDEMYSELNFIQKNKTGLKERFVVDAEMLVQNQWGFIADYKCFGSFYMIGAIKDPHQFVQKIREVECHQAYYLGINYLEDSQAIVIRLIAKNAVEFHKLKFEILKKWRKHQFDTEMLRMRK